MGARQLPQQRPPSHRPTKPPRPLRLGAGLINTGDAGMLSWLFSCAHVVVCIIRRADKRNENSECSEEVLNLTGLLPSGLQTRGALRPRRSGTSKATCARALWFGAWQAGRDCARMGGRKKKKLYARGEHRGRSFMRSSSLLTNLTVLPPRRGSSRLLFIAPTDAL